MSAEIRGLDAELARLSGLTNWESAPRATMRQGLQAIESLLSLCGNPQAAMRFVHVTGTKGKGSVCSLLEQALVAAGLTVGRYSSPHLAAVNERVSICARPVADEILAPLIARVVDEIESARINGGDAADATWFDAMTAASFMAFQAAGCEWVMLEVGLGGRFDSTNIATAEVAVVTNVELEHTEVLGPTRGVIAYQKAGIIKPGAVVVTPLRSEDEAGQVIHAEAAAMDARIRLVTPEGATTGATNVAIAGTVLDELGKIGVNGPEQPVGRRLLTDGVVHAAALPGRMEHFICHVGEDSPERETTVVLDGAHVPFNLEAVLRDLAARPNTTAPCVVVFAAGEDKDAVGLLDVLARRASSVILTALPKPARMTDPSRLALVTGPRSVNVRVEPCPETALHKALLEASRLGIWVFVTGSLHLAGHLRPLLVGRFQGRTGDLTLRRHYFELPR